MIESGPGSRDYRRWLASRGLTVAGRAAVTPARRGPGLPPPCGSGRSTEPGAFWDSLWDYFGVLGQRGDGPVLAGGPMPEVTWFPGATLNYARNALRAAATDPDRTAVIARDEAGSQVTLSYGELAAEVARVRAGLAALGVTRGDRVAAYLPNVPAALIGLLATASLGAIWSSCSPDFGAHSVIDRFAQITPKVLLAAGHYRYGGKEFDRGAAVAEIAAALPGLAAVIMVGDTGGRGPTLPAGVAALPFDALPGDGEQARSSPRSRSAIRCGCCTPPAPPGCPKRSCTATVASCWSISRRSACTRTSAPATCSSGTPPPAG